MYGTVAHIRVKAGQGEAVLATMAKWASEEMPRVEGDRGGYLFRLDSDSQEMIMIAVFRDKESYVANADDPETDKWYQEMRQHLEADPVWHDGEIIGSWSK